MSEVKERPILFSAPMVRAIIGGQKTQTRRVMKIQPPSPEFQLATLVATSEDRRDIGKQHWATIDGYTIVDGSQPYFSCPYGYPGDRLWVRETWKPHPVIQNPMPIIYRATDGGCWPCLPWKPSIHMPRWASRITLEITGVRVERLQEISADDCAAEGVGQRFLPESNLKALFSNLWESINGADSWDANPWVWVIEFRKLP